MHELALESGARIVHACGYDSIPSDLGMLLLHERVVADGAGPLTDVRLVATVRGGFSGGTIDSLRAQIEAYESNPGLRRVAADPHALSPDRAAEPAPAQPRDAGMPSRAADGTWRAPFVMAPFNTRIVRRSNALLDWAYGPELRYGEVMGAGQGVTGVLMAAGITGGLAGLVGAMSVKPVRGLLDRVLPAPGTGPSEQARAKGRHARAERPLPGPRPPPAAVRLTHARDGHGPASDRSPAARRPHLRRHDRLTHAAVGVGCFLRPREACPRRGTEASEGWFSVSMRHAGLEGS
ncbi:hypothetical protein [Lentzea sp. NPDC092896]|uniref:hypothetical protein n=1 Tax=Lentzea sp. NPDC092896 TaxID=3364127 RepID=UPI0037FBA812